MKDTIARLRALEAAATPRPWQARAYDEDTDTTMMFFGDYSSGCNRYVEVGEADAQLIAEVRNALLKLLAELEIKTAALDELREAYTVVGHYQWCTKVLEKMDEDLGALERTNE